MSRETRLLVLTIAVSGLVLLLLAQLRFPEAPSVVGTAAAPLERLAARASFEELATRIAQLETTIARDLIVLRLVPRSDPAPSRLDDVLTRLDTSIPDVRHVAALRLDATAALAAIPPTAIIGGLVGSADPSGTTGIVARDPVRGLARVRVPEAAARAVPQLALAELRTPTYVVAVEGTQAGLTLRPVFLGRSERFQSPRWTRPLLPLGGIVVTPGALMFSLDGEFLGSAVVENGMLAIAGASDVVQIVRALESSPPPPVDPGIAVQPLTPRLAAATGTTRGIVVAEVADNSPASVALEPGDVITAIDGRAVDTPQAALLRLATQLATGPVAIAFVRHGEMQTAELHPQAGAAGPALDTLELQTIRGVGARVTAVDTATAFESAGLATGDVIVRAGGIASPTAAQVRRAIGDTEPGAFLVLTVRRGDRQLFVPVRLPATSRGLRP